MVSNFNCIFCFLALWLAGVFPGGCLPGCQVVVAGGEDSADKIPGIVGHAIKYRDFIPHYSYFLLFVYFLAFSILSKTQSYVDANLRKKG